MRRLERTASGTSLDVTAFMAGEWWSGIEMRHLVALDAVAREGSFRRAATRLGYVQSAISHQIAALEGLIGKRLIDRSRGTRPLALTPAGEILLAHADALIARVRAAQADLAALDGEGVAALRVGATPDLLARLVPVAPARVRRAGHAARDAGHAVAARGADPGRARPRARRDAACRRGRSTRCRSAPTRSSRSCRPEPRSPKRRRAVTCRRAGTAAADRACTDARARRGAVARPRRSSRASCSRRQPVPPSRDSSRPASALPCCRASRSTSVGSRPSCSISRTASSPTGWSLSSGRVCSHRVHDAAAFVESARSACAGERLREPLLAGLTRLIGCIRRRRSTKASAARLEPA